MAKKWITGITVRGPLVQWSSIPSHPVPNPHVVAKSFELDLGESPGFLEAIQTDSSRFYPALRKNLGTPQGLTVLGIPASWILTRIIQIPTAPAEEMRSMIELQVDKWSPFPIENVVIAWELLKEQEGQSRVIVSIIRQETVEAIGQLFRGAGIAINRIDINSLGWWHLISHTPGAVHTVGRQLFIILDGDTCDLILTHDGLPSVMRSLGGLTSLPADEMIEEIVHEAGTTLSALDAEVGGIMAPISLWYRETEPSDLIQRLHDQHTLATHSTSLEILPPLSHGIAERSKASTPLLNLAPPIWREKAQLRKTYGRFIAASIAIAALWLAAVSTLIGAMYIQKSTIARMQQRLTVLNGPAETVRDLQKRVMGLQQYNDRSHSALECLREITEAMPAGGIEFKSFSYRKGKVVELAGHASSVNLVYDFKKALDASKMFTAIELGRTAPDNTGREVFKMTAKLPEGGSAE